MSIYLSIYLFNICHSCDILQPSICPHISLASPWSAPSNLSIDLNLREAEEEKELLLLKIANISLIVTGHLSFSL